jgi:ribonuclease VapC
MAADGGVVLDASAILALLEGERGADEVEMILDGSILSAVNLSEVLQKTIHHDVDTDGLEYDLEALGVEIGPFDALRARAAAELWERAPRAGLSLGDRACLPLPRGSAWRSPRRTGGGPRSTSTFPFVSPADRVVPPIAFVAIASPYGTRRHPRRGGSAGADRSDARR